MKKNIKNFLAPCLLTSYILTSHQLQAIELYNDGINQFSSTGFFNIGYYDHESTNDISSFSSRVGFQFNRKVNDEWTAISWVEYGIDPLSSNTGSAPFAGDQQLGDGDKGDDIWNRIGLVGLKHDKYGTISIGKLWSGYWFVAGRNDIFENAGGSSTGIYNYGTDGGASGTGRADSALQYANTFNDFQVFFQYQAQEKEVDLYDLNQLAALENDTLEGDLEPIDTIKLESNYGLAVLYNLNEKVTFGAAYNQADFNLENSLETTDGTVDEAYAFSVSYGDLFTQALAHRSYGFYTALVVYQGKNHEIDNEGNLLDTRGIEFSALYNFENDWTVYIGYNHLEEDDSTYQEFYQLENDMESQFELEYHLAGVKYNFDHFVRGYIEYRGSDSKNANGTARDGDLVTVGLKVFLF